MPTDAGCLYNLNTGQKYNAPLFHRAAIITYCSAIGLQRNNKAEYKLTCTLGN